MKIGWLMLTVHILLLIMFARSNESDKEIQEENSVLVLNEKNFDQALLKHDLLLVEFYAPWCGHCKKLAPHYAEAAKILRAENPPFYLAKVDATESSELAKKYDIQGYPTLKMFNRGEQEDYTGGRTKDEIIQWIRRKTAPTVKTLKTVEDVKNFKSSSDVTIVFFGSQNKMFEMYTELAKAYDDMLFGECSSKECLNHYNVHPGNIVMFRDFDENHAVLGKDKYNEDELKSFVDQNTLPLISPFDEKAAQLIFSKQNPGLFFYRSKGTEFESKFETLAKEISSEVSGKIHIILTDIKDDLENKLAEYIGVTLADLPTIRIHDTRNELKKYTFEGEFTKENLMNFINEWISGKLTPKLKSEDESVTKENSNPVIPIVGKNFNEIVMDASKHVLVEFYAPWCMHCQKLIPVYEELAIKLKETNPNVLVTKIDATSNDIEGQEIQGFPTIKLFKKNDKKSPIDFEGEKNLNGLVNFLATHIKEFNKPDISKEIGHEEM